MVVIDLPATADTGVTHERNGVPSTCTVQAPHCAIPQPNLVPVKPRTSRKTQSNGMSGEVSILRLVPLTVNCIAVMRCNFGRPMRHVNAGKLPQPRWVDKVAAMRSAIRVALALLLVGCHLGPQERVVPLRGHLVLEVEPNPIVATPLGGDLYELKFDIIMREQGGAGVRIENFTVDAIAFRTVTVQSQTFPGTYITERGYPARVEAGKYLRFSFVKRWHLPTTFLRSGASARVTTRTVDDNGLRDVTETRVGVVLRD